MHLEGQGVCLCTCKTLLMAFDAWLRQFSRFHPWKQQQQYPSEPRKLPIFLDQLLATPAPVAVEQPAEELSQNSRLFWLVTNWSCHSLTSRRKSDPRCNNTLVLNPRSAASAPPKIGNRKMQRNLGMQPA